MVSTPTWVGSTGSSPVIIQIKNKSMLIFGTIACIIITCAYIPQCIKVYKTKDVKGLSIPTFIAIWCGVILWTIHAIIINDTPLLISSIASFIQNTFILRYMIWK